MALEGTTHEVHIKNTTKEKLKRKGALLITAATIAAGCSTGVEDFTDGEEESADDLGQLEEALSKPTQTGRPRPTHNDEAMIEYQKDCEEGASHPGKKAGKKRSGKKKAAVSHEVREGRKQFYSGRMPGGPLGSRSRKA